MLVPERGQPTRRIGRFGAGKAGRTAESGWATTRGTLRRTRQMRRRSPKALIVRIANGF
jgi:hypothetical protein